MKRLIAPILAVLLGAGTAVVLAATPASAHTAAAACGPGYVTASDGVRAVKTASGAVYGRVYLMWNSAKRTNCVVTIKEGSLHGRSTWTEAFLAVENDPGPDDGWFGERGNFSHYAGGLPANKTVRFAADKCVIYYGRIYSQPNRGGTVAEGGRMEPGNCGS